MSIQSMQSTEHRQSVRVGILSGVMGQIDDVVAGINEGANLGDDATYSSTLGAALEGALLGVPSIAASQQSRDGRFRLIDLTGYDFEVGSQILVYLVRQMIETRDQIPARSVLNLNFPGTVATGLRLAHFDERHWTQESIGTVKSENGKIGYLLFGTHPQIDPVFRMMLGSDAWAISRGFATMTPLTVNWSNGLPRI